MSTQQLVFFPLFALAILLFIISCVQRLRLVAIGAPENRFGQPAARLAGMLTFAFGQRRVLQRPWGVNHFVIFWSFMVLLLANGEFLLAGLFPQLTFARLPDPAYRTLLWIFDLVSLLALAGVLLAAARRIFFPADYLASSYTSPRSGQALLILAFIAILMLAYFLLHGAEIRLGEKAAYAAAMPVSGIFAALLAGLSPGALHLVSLTAWWTHALVLLVFLNLLPRSKHMHILTAIPNCFFRNLDRPGSLPRETFEKGRKFGVDTIDRFTWKDLLDSFTCTECGRCQDVCPARGTDKDLNPREIIHDIKVNLLANGPALRQGNTSALPLIGEGHAGSIGEGSIWDCTTCGACQKVCPVLIEHPQKVIKMRRHLVQMESRFPGELLNLFENMEQRSNPWGIAPADRGKWSTLLGDRSFQGDACEYLFYVGCAGAFDTRSKQVTVALATLFDAAGLTWGILGKDELCCGDSLRRLGNEYVFERMARQNVELLRARGVKKIVTQCPHCFSTFANDYRQYGLDVEIIHHSQLLAQLLADGRLQPAKKLDAGRLVFHDSCYLGRYNEVYAAPRQVLQAATGAAPGELPHHRDNAFCCGAGGGRMWMEENTGTRINVARVREALAEKAETICVSCPYCMTMLEDGLKDEGADDRVRVKDIAEVLAEALR
ncbi:MAG: (Fe-S)-binding protein [Desulfuromonadales bacterium]